MRIDGREPGEPRPACIVPGHQIFADGSALIEVGHTKVLCAASVDERVPHFLRSSGKGWITAEYAMLPRATLSRTPRDNTGRPNGRASEIQRLIGRSLRSITDLKGLGERTIILDCDVLQADGGTRTAAITGAYIALYQALSNLVHHKVIPSIPLRNAVAAISVGVVEDIPLLDLCYEEDARALVDFNVVMTDQGQFIELQGSAEGAPFSRDTTDRMLALAWEGIQYLLKVQRDVAESL